MPVLKNWQPHRDEFERVVPFTEPSQVDFMGFVLRNVARLSRSQGYRDAQMEELVTAVEEMAEALNVVMAVLNGKKVVNVELGPKGKKMIMVREFKAKPIEVEKILKTKRPD